jgi:hypothetical protein
MAPGSGGYQSQRVVDHPQREDVLHLGWGLDQATNGVELRLNPKPPTVP